MMSLTGKMCVKMNQSISQGKLAGWSADFYKLTLTCQAICKSLNRVHSHLFFLRRVLTNLQCTWYPKIRCSNTFRLYSEYHIIYYPQFYYTVDNAREKWRKQGILASASKLIRWWFWFDTECCDYIGTSSRIEKIVIIFVSLRFCISHGCYLKCYSTLIFTHL